MFTLKKLPLHWLTLIPAWYVSLWVKIACKRKRYTLPDVKGADVCAVTNVLPKMIDTIEEMIMDLFMALCKKGSGDSITIIARVTCFCDIHIVTLK